MLGRVGATLVSPPCWRALGRERRGNGKAGGELCGARYGGGFWGAGDGEATGETGELGRSESRAELDTVRAWAE